MPALIAAEVPILAMEAGLAALASFTLVGPLGLPWWLPVVFWRRRAARGRAAERRTALARGFWSGLAVLRSVQGRNGLFALVLLAVFAQIARNWLMLEAVGVNASVFDATAVLIVMVTLSQLPVGPSVGAAAVVLILGADGAALAAARVSCSPRRARSARSPTQAGRASTVCRLADLPRGAVPSRLGRTSVANRSPAIGVTQ